MECAYKQLAGTLEQPTAMGRAGMRSLPACGQVCPVALVRWDCGNRFERTRRPGRGGGSGEEGHDKGREISPDQGDAAAGGWQIVGGGSLLQQGPEMGRFRELICRGTAFDCVSQTLEGGQVLRRQGLFEFHQSVMLDRKKLVEEWFEIAADANADADFAGWSVHGFPGLDATWCAHYFSLVRP